MVVGAGLMGIEVQWAWLKWRVLWNEWSVTYRDFGEEDGLS